MSRISRVQEKLQAAGLNQALFVDPMSIRYLCGYYTEPFERFLGLLIGPKGCSLFVNALFPEAQVDGIEVVVYEDAENPLTKVAERLVPGSLGVDKDLPARFMLPLQSMVAGLNFSLASFAVDEVRAVKDALEQEKMREASRINDLAIDWLCAQVRPGVTEAEITDGLLAEYKRLGAEAHSFSPIVSFGANAADPHHEPDDTAFELGDMVLFDVGCKKDGYCSDMTRVFFTKEPDAKQREVYETVRRANEEAEKLASAGRIFSELDLCARKIIEDAGYGNYFTHRLGHQIGLVDHEPGDVSATNHTKVEAGNCFSIEPGIYIPGLIGVRIEDLLIAKEDGAEILNSYPKDIQILSL